MVENDEYFNDIKNDESFKSIFEEHQAEVIAYPLYGISSQIVINKFNLIPIKKNNINNITINFRQKQRLLLKSGICIKFLQKLLYNYSNNYKKIIKNVKSIISQRHYKGIKGKGEYFYNEAIKYFDNNTSVELDKNCMELLTKSALLQYNDAMLKLAYLLNNNNFNNKLSFQLYNTLADKGIAEAQYNVSFMFNNLEKQITYLTLAANQGYHHALSYLASKYEDGHYVEQDIDKAVELYTLAAQNGCGYSYYCIGRIYDFGFADVLPNKEKALKYYKLAMETDEYFTFYYDKLNNE
jgi:TPR repeat protein